MESNEMKQYLPVLTPVLHKTKPLASPKHYHAWSSHQSSP